MAYDLGEYGDIFREMVAQGRGREKESFLDLTRALEARGVSPAATLQKGAGELREKTAGQERQLGAELAARAGGERFQTAERLGTEKSALQRLQIGEAGAMARLNKELNAAMERMKWQVETQRAYAEDAAKKQRKAGYAQMGLSMLAGGVAGGIAPKLFGKGISPWGGAGRGLLMGAPGMAGLFGQQAGYSMGTNNIMDLFRQFLEESSRGGGSGHTPTEAGQNTPEVIGQLWR